LLGSKDLPLLLDPLADDPKQEEPNQTATLSMARGRQHLLRTLEKRILIKQWP
jgi:hypothetical protein